MFMGAPPFVQDVFETAIKRSGVRLAWAKAHTCPCVNQGLDSDGYSNDGAPRSDCAQCFGAGIYWDDFTVPFTGLLTLSGFMPLPTEPGFRNDEKWGLTGNAAPLVTLIASENRQAYDQASTYDQIVEVDTQARYNTVLISGVRDALPYVNGINVAPAGAVTVWNPDTKTAVPAAYRVHGTVLELLDYPEGTPYAVEFYAASTYVLFRRSGGLPHSRPLGGGLSDYPKRWVADTLDQWLRDKQGKAKPPRWRETATATLQPISHNTLQSSNQPGRFGGGAAIGNSSNIGAIGTRVITGRTGGAVLTGGGNNTAGGLVRRA